MDLGSREVMQHNTQTLWEALGFGCIEVVFCSEDEANCIAQVQYQSNPCTGSCSMHKLCGPCSLLIHAHAADISTTNDSILSLSAFIHISRCHDTRDLSSVLVSLTSDKVPAYCSIITHITLQGRMLSCSLCSNGDFDQGIC